MEPGDIFDCAFSVKQEKIDMSLNDNEDYQTIDKAPHVQNIELSQFIHGNSIQSLKQEYDETAEPHEDMEIILECKDVKPDKGLLVVKKMEDSSENHLQNMIFSDQTQKTIIVENAGVVKKEFVGEEAETLTINSDCELSKQNDKRRVEETSIYKHRLNTSIDKVNCSITCDTCGLKFKTKLGLKRHNDVKHKGIRHACNECGNSFTQRSHLKTHIETVHNGITHACNQCLRSYSRKSYLKMHIDNVHNGVSHVCNECGKSYAQRSHLKTHIESLHNGVTYTCNQCGRSYSQKSYLKIHIDKVHLDITYVCDVCKKNFSTKSNLNIHINSVHKGISHKCDLCEKNFKYRSHLCNHVKMSHNGNTHTCKVCGKTFGQRKNLQAHIDIAHTRAS
ncbi:zinc finger protein 616-like [Trichogramma pretiosum]|uniref:zinc finger protein 616-like n=1 Tax=Trichogramma pretiosum TaxID=7493 RepID=UPI0006C9CE4C|nr:zinc finger protein 616-like [Trichogramma pretiosum]